METACPNVQTEQTINEVIIGATSESGGSRRNTITIGGEAKSEKKNKPVLMLDIFDTPPLLPASVKKIYKDKIQDPVTWAKCCVEDFGAEMIALELISTNPSVLDRSAEETQDVILKVLDAVDVPIMISGSGDIPKDSEILPAAAKAAAGERCILSSITFDNYKRIASAAVQYNHAIVAATSMSIDYAISLNRQLMREGVPADSIVMDLSTCPLGYGFEYTYSIMERVRLEAFNGNGLAQLPILFCNANSWAAREAKAKDPDWGDWEHRGYSWEMVTGISGLMAGANLLLMLHPVAYREVNNFIKQWSE